MNVLENIISKEDFESLEPYERGYHIGLFGDTPEQPNIKDEENPFPSGTDWHSQWNFGFMHGINERLYENY